MSKRKQKFKTVRSVELSPESATAEVLTTGWMLAVMATLVCLVAATILHWFIGRDAEAARLTILADLLFFAAATIGGFSLLLVPLVYHLRRQPPPMAVTAVAAAIGAAPLVMLLAKML